MNQIPSPAQSRVPSEGGTFCRRMRLHAPDVADHMLRVGELALRVASMAGLTSVQRRRAGLAGGLHDVGKLAVPRQILEKAEPLSSSERALVRGHSLVGAGLLAESDRLAAVAGIVRAVHERWDGAGYPDGLAGEEIPVEARLIAVCDAWDAMTQCRGDRVPLSGSGALAELERGAGSQFDPTMVGAFTSVVLGTWPFN
jgi:HD-GYP domain-containing protein (c-di-GMP phosphodiesterase class II)